MVNITSSISRYTIIEGQIQNPFKLPQYNFGKSINESTWSYYVNTLYIILLC